ncbi:MAG: folylpolyglutamate synthase/dihydrofolate synthase family protein [Oceanipulchritudo sp.]
MKQDLQTYDEVRSYLYGLKHRGALYGIDRMKAFVERLGHPERAWPAVHVAGTNGKGSTCAMLEAIFRAAGHRTGLFTSPHLVHQGERVQVDRTILTRDEIIHYTRQLKALAEKLGTVSADLHPTFFEFMTGMAFQHFMESRVDVGIIETGLGGRLDATNVLDPALSVITSISLDHTEILGDTFEAIAFEKAGIIKPGRPVVMGLLPVEAERVVEAVARERGAPLYKVSDSFGVDDARFPMTALAGDYQRRNAATATLAARMLADRFSLSESHIREGLLGVNWSGRWERHCLLDRSIILDATHNPEGVLHLERNLERFVDEEGYRPIVLAGTLGLARARALIPAACRYARELHLLVPKQPRACSFEVLKGEVPSTFSGKVRTCRIGDVFPAPGACALGNPGETVVATGSIYLIGEIMEALYHDTPVGEASLQD